MRFRNGSSVPLDQSSSGVPNMADTLNGWLMPMIFTLVTKSQVNYQTYETKEDISFQGIWQPFTKEQLKMKPEGQRSWRWFTCHSYTQLPLETDMIIGYKGVNYRVANIGIYNEYGYYEYELVNDYTGSGPYAP